MKIILLASFPQSGNSFLRNTIEDMYGIPTFSVYPEDRKEGNPAELILYQGDHPDAVLIWNEAYSKRIYKPDIAFIKTHEESDSLLPYPAIHIVRDGRDALISYAHFLVGVEKTERSYLEMLQYQIETKAWSDFVMAWYKNSKVEYIVKFEKMLKNPVREVVKVGDIAGLKPPLLKNIKLRIFEEFQTEKPDIFKRGKANVWKDTKEMPEVLHKLFWQYNKNAMDLLEYK